MTSHPSIVYGSNQSFSPASSLLLKDLLSDPRDQRMTDVPYILEYLILGQLETSFVETRRAQVLLARGYHTRKLRNEISAEEGFR